MESSDDQLIRAIYDVSMRDDAVPDILDRLCDSIGAYGAMIFDCTQRGNNRQVGLLHHSSAYEPALLEWYVAEFNRQEVQDQDRLADLSSTGDEINLIHDEALYSGAARPGPNVEAMANYGIQARFGALLNKESWNTDRFAFQFAKGTPLPDAAQLARAENILSHLAKALSIGRALKRSSWMEQALSSYLDGLPVGLGIVDARANLLYGNTELRRIAQDWPDVEFSRGGGLVFHAGNAELNALLTQDNAHGRFGARPRREAVFLPGHREDDGLFIEICPIDDHPEMERFGSGARLVSVLDSSVGRQIDADIVARFFPLSKSEVAVLDLLSQGHSNVQIAELRARSVETVNSQIKSLLRKTNSRNRTEVVKVAVGLSAYGRAQGG